MQDFCEKGSNWHHYQFISALIGVQPSLVFLPICIQIIYNNDPKIGHLNTRNFQNSDFLMPSIQIILTVIVLNQTVLTDHQTMFLI